MNKTRVLICGASGFIGWNLFEHFNSLGNSYEVHGTYCRNQTLYFVTNYHCFDLRDKDRAIEATKGMDIVINCAAMTDGMGAFDPDTYTPVNIQINQNLIEAAHINNVKHFIFLSCTVMYPPSKRPLLENEHDLRNVHPKYKAVAQMKLDGERLCQSYANLGHTKYTAIRHSNIYGPYDKFDLKRGHVLSATIEKIMTSEKEFIIWGPGTETRDFLHINDLVDFIEKALEHQKSLFEIFNVGLGKMHSVNELVQQILLLSKKNLSFVHNLEKKPIEQAAIDISKASERVGWQPKIDLIEGLKKTLVWYRSNRSA